MADDLTRDDSRPRDFALLAILFFLARSMALFWFAPFYSDFSQFLFSFAALSEAGAYPFLQYWLEYPPVFPWISVGVYRLVTWFTGGLTAGASLSAVHWWYCTAMGLLMAVFDTGNLVLVYLIAKENWGGHAAFRASWVYVLLFYPLLVAMSYFDGFVLFWLLLSVWLFLRGRGTVSAAALAVGVMAKFIPIIFVPVALKYATTWRRRIAWLAVFTAVCLALVAPFLAVNPRAVETSFKVTAIRKPWETVWALLQGYTGWGTVGPTEMYLRSHPDPGWDRLAGNEVAEFARSISCIDPPQTQPVLYLRTISRFSPDIGFVERGRADPCYAMMAVPFLALLGYLLWKGRGDPSARNVLWFSLAALCIFLLYSKGWSPQFVIYPIALVLVAIGGMQGVVLAILLNVVTFMEMPIWLVWPGLMGGTGADLVLWAVVAARTVLLLLILATCVVRLRRA